MIQLYIVIFVGVIILLAFLVVLYQQDVDRFQQEIRKMNKQLTDDQIVINKYITIQQQLQKQLDYWKKVKQNVR